jgi:hypothetical protein
MLDSDRSFDQTQSGHDQARGQPEFDLGSVNVVIVPGPGSRLGEMSPS